MSLRTVAMPLVRKSSKDFFCTSIRFGISMTSSIREKDNLFVLPSVCSCTIPLIHSISFVAARVPLTVKTAKSCGKFHAHPPKVGFRRGFHTKRFAPILIFAYFCIVAQYDILSQFPRLVKSFSQKRGKICAKVRFRPLLPNFLRQFCPARLHFAKKCGTLCG